MSNKNGNNAGLPVLASNYKTFPAVVNTSMPEIDDEVLEQIDESDAEGYEATQERLPFVSIRQKDLKDAKGKVIRSAGHFRISDKACPDMPDADGEKGLVVTVLADQSSRVYWPNLTDDKPSCKSNDGRVGMGEPGGDCATCKHGQWKQDGTRPDCAQHINLCCYDHTVKRAYIVNIGRSGLRPWNDFKAILKHNTVSVKGKTFPVPIHFMEIRITVAYVQEPSPHYVPVFTLVNSLSGTMVAMMKQYRSELGTAISKTIDAVDAVDEENGNDTDNGADPPEFNELPEGVEPVNHADLGLDS